MGKSEGLLLLLLLLLLIHCRVDRILQLEMVVVRVLVFRSF